ncbi:MAG TPA: HDOD domain-containing protein, partial [Candidatus Marinimicrobia bacterium]|nr:HDOD domain-containing protein [Candidatus Neomarinimicrobiota bacterium]
ALSQKVVEIFTDGHSVEDYNRLALWRHSIGVALIARSIFRRELGLRGENIYAAALMHDIGLIAEEQFMTREFKEAIKHSNENKTPLDVAENKIIGFDHADIGKAICESWVFPEEFTAAIGRHHDPLTIEDENIRYASTIYIADFLAAENDIGFCDMKNGNERIFMRCLRKLDISSASLNSIVKEALEELQQMEDKGLI